MSPAKKNGNSMRSLTPEDIQVAKDVVFQGIKITCQEVRTHKVALVEGFEAPTVTEAIARYLFGAGILQAVYVDLSLAKEYLGMNAPPKEQVYKDVCRIIGNNNTLPKDFIEDERNPWIAEGIGHLLLSLSIHCPNLGPPGELTALTPIHDYVKERGLDMVGLHEENDGFVGLCVGETKASELNATNHVTNAGALFAEIDAGAREVHIRQKVLLLSAGFDEGFRSRLPQGFWHNRRAYLPIVAYSSRSNFNPSHARSSLGTLSVGADRVRLVCVVLEDYSSFFDAVADHMRAEVDRFPEDPNVW